MDYVVIECTADVPPSVRYEFTHLWIVQGIVQPVYRSVQLPCLSSTVNNVGVTVARYCPIYSEQYISPLWILDEEQLEVPCRCVGQRSVLYSTLFLSGINSRYLIVPEF